MGDILFEETGRLGLVTLNRPKALNALTHDMALMLEERLLRWRDLDRVAAVAIYGAGPKAFCAGGDVRALWEVGLKHGELNWQFYADEYRLDTLVKRFPKPYVAFMDGIAMGGGLGVSLHGSHRVSGDATMIAMPECGIGLFPDIGATYALPRLPGQTGMWMALTGARLKAADACAAGLCDLHIPSDRQGAAIAALTEAEFEDGAPSPVTETLRRFAGDPGPAALHERRDAIDRCFSGDSVEAILAALEAEGGDWAAAQAAAIRRGSPTSLRLAFRSMREGVGREFEDCMRVEYRLARFCMTHPDFYEGVRATIIDKDGAPRWRPATLEEAGPETVEAAFAPPPPGDELSLPDAD